MTANDWPDGNTIGFLFPDELVEKYGLKAGDVFTPVGVDGGIVLRATNSELSERLRAVGAEDVTYRVKLQDLSKLA